MNERALTTNELSGAQHARVAEVRRAPFGQHRRLSLALGLMIAACGREKGLAGAPDASSAAGSLSAFGDGGVEKDAAAVYTKACDGGDADACSDLGLLFEQGNGVGEDGARATALFTRACDAGSPLGCANLGLLFEGGLGVAKDEAHAAALYTKACDAGNTSGCSFLAFLLGEGRGVAKDEARSMALFTKACDGGDGRSCLNLGSLFERGRGVTKDEARAAPFYVKACDAGIMDGCSFLASLLEEGRGGLAKDEAHAATLYTRACDAGFAPACSWLGVLFEQGRGVSKEEARAATLYTRACDGSVGQCKATPGRVGRRGDPKLCGVGFGPGCRHLGTLFEHGRGVDRDEARAAAAYDRGCALRDPQSCARAFKGPKVDLGSSTLAGGQVANASDVVAGMNAGFRRCVSKADPPTVRNGATVHLVAVIGKNGEVLSTKSTSSDGLPKIAVDCMAARVASAQFSHPEGASSTLEISATVTVP
jgi:TPR repeat protein